MEFIWNDNAGEDVRHTSEKALKQQQAEEFREASTRYINHAKALDAEATRLENLPTATMRVSSTSTNAAGEEVTTWSTVTDHNTMRIRRERIAALRDFAQRWRSSAQEPLNAADKLITNATKTTVHYRNSHIRAKAADHMYAQQIQGIGELWYSIAQKLQRQECCVDIERNVPSTDSSFAFAVEQQNTAL